MTQKHIVIIGGGFGGLYAAQKLQGIDARITLIDKRNFHLFQPLLYQVATGVLSPADIASPLRGVLANQKNTTVLMGEVKDIDPDSKKIYVSGGEEIDYDYAIVATGVSHHYFGNDHWSQWAPGLKTVEDAINIRRRILDAFETAEKETDPEKRKALLTFVVIGGGPTGVELAGAIGELANHTLHDEFSNINTTEAEILLLEGFERILPPYAPDLSASATDALTKLGVTVKTGAIVTNIHDHVVTFRCGDRTEEVTAQTILWAAGVKASALGEILAKRADAPLDRVGRVMVSPDLSVPNHPSLFVIGDLAHYAHQDEGKPLPGVAPVAMQQGEFIAKLLKAQIRNLPLPQFRYVDRGSLAVIGRNAAVVDLRFMKLTGMPAWLIWTFLHIFYLVEFDNQLVVMVQWAFNYFTRKRGARIITTKYSQQVTIPEVSIPEVSTT
ncbi:NADH dehydrogenase, FAD-containing subunit [Synechococcus sp. PCC 7502]|uniref:NAD(P)/FAD-dependent oxidoreductase n=1 Tax=Synechococcus sp. PCC 7502 TaxID=1173263 RepID=UPI00029FE13F|nr:NAD(P)/FAD-dependent oxidoreductase [Synechococcus sp. PCC 7502]AFY74048.1 NADH dehydrogenase, FAD-containing subunit [Synechococcus sp. PCC 7502]